jgi:L-fuculose-phosphate aldolase
MAARQQLLTHGFGGWTTWSDEQESLSKRGNIYHDAAVASVWDYFVRQLEAGQEPRRPLM